MLEERSFDEPGAEHPAAEGTSKPFDPSLELILRLLCLGPLFEWVRPQATRALVRGFESGGASGLLDAASEGWAWSRGIVYVACLAIVVLGPRRALVLGWAAAHVIDLMRAISTNSLSSGYAEKGFLVCTSVGVAALVLQGSATRTAVAESTRFLLRGLVATGFAFVALNKLNADFLDPVTSCASVLTQGLMARIPMAEALMAAVSGAAWPSLVMEASILPLILVKPRWGVFYAWCVFTGIAQVGPRGTTFVFMAAALVFLPTADWQARRVDRRRMFLIGLAAWLLGLLFCMAALDPSRRWDVHQLLPRASFLALALMGIGALGWNAGRGFKTGLPARDWSIRPPAVGRIIVLAILGLFLLNELSPYLGLKSKYSLTMWSNLRADAGRWNSLVFPEWMRVSGQADRAFFSVTEIRRHVPRVKPAPGPSASGHAIVAAPFMATPETSLAWLRRAESRAGPLRFEVEYLGERRGFVGSGSRGDFAAFVEQKRPHVDWFDGRRMTLDQPQSCLGP